MSGISTPMLHKKMSEREAFRNRFRLALADAGYTDVGPTNVSREFNIRFSHSPITVHAARKWLMGEAIPSQEKMQVLSSWLGVAPDWLRFGSSAQYGTASFTGITSGFPTATMIGDLQALDEDHRIAAKEMIRALLKLNNLRREGQP